MTLEEARQEGYDAYWDGLGQTDNPYEVEDAPVEHRRWEEGWAAAQVDDYDESE